jgi:glycosyltransferase involved in cell wall biosynthesis
MYSQEEKKLLYLGNKLSNKGNIKTVLETLVPLFSEFLVVQSGSSVNNKALRMLHFIWLFITKQRKADYILVDTFSTLNFNYAFVLVFLSKIFGKKCILFLHGGNLPKRLNGKFINRFTFDNAYGMVAPSNYLKSQFENAGYEVTMIPNLVETQNYKYKERKRCSPKILWVRSFAAHYNPELAIKVVNLLKDKHSDVELCMVGPERDGSMEKTKALAKSLGIENRVKFTGLLSQQEWSELSSGYDIFINTTNIDNTPISLLESMALGIPVISTNVGGIPYLIEDAYNGLLVEADAPDKMTDSIERLLSDDQLANSLSVQGKEVADSHDWKVVQNQWKEVFEI